MQERRLCGVCCVEGARQEFPGSAPGQAAWISGLQGGWVLPPTLLFGVPDVALACYFYLSIKFILVLLLKLSAL